MAGLDNARVPDYLRAQGVIGISVNGVKAYADEEPCSDEPDCDCSGCEEGRRYWRETESDHAFWTR